MADYFDIYGTRIPISSIKDFRIIDVEFIFRPVYREAKKSMLNTISNKKFEFDSMQPYAAIIGQQGNKSELGEYKAKDFKEALGKDISGAVIYTIADKLKLKAFKYEKYQCINMAGRAFTTYLDDVPTVLKWNNGREAEVHKEDSLYTLLGEVTTPVRQNVPALIIKVNEVFCFYGNGIQIDNVAYEYERLKLEIDNHILNGKHRKKLNSSEKFVLPQLPKLQIPLKVNKESNIIDVEIEEISDE